ncbi:hypothetical protein ACFVY0_46715 [Streptomyces sp. NPDC058286]
MRGAEGVGKELCGGDLLEDLLGEDDLVVVDGAGGVMAGLEGITDDA